MHKSTTDGWRRPDDLETVIRRKLRQELPSHEDVNQLAADLAATIRKLRQG